jgi:hypothetical protein
MRIVASLVLIVSLLSPVVLSAHVNILTAHNDNGRTGANTNETILSPSTVGSNSFGRLFTQPVDGPIYAQPLFVSNLPIPGKGTHNVAFVATMHDSVFAFDADAASGANSAPLWKTSFFNTNAGVFVPITTDATDDPGQDCHTFGPGEIGIVGTPVIDLNSQTLYVVARTKELLPPPNSGTYTQYHKLHALDLTTGAERPNSPVLVDGVVPGTGAGSIGGFQHFDQKKHIQRPALLLVNGIVYVSFCSYCDLDIYHGWIMGYDATTLQQLAAFNTTPNATEGGIWMGGAGPAADTSGAVYCVTGNGTFDLGANPQDFGDSFLKLVQTNGNLLAWDYFAPFDQGTMDSGDEDLGASGVILLPDSVGSALHPHLMTGSGKTGKIYLVDRDTLGHFNSANDSQIVQETPFYTLRPGTPHFFGAPAYWNGRIYIQGVGEYLKAFGIANGAINTTPVSQNNDIVSIRGATPSISANGNTGGIVWELSVTTLRAYNATNLTQKLYDSALNVQQGWADQISSYVKFTVPTPANGKVYVPSGDSLVVFGLHTINLTRISPTVLRITYTAPSFNTFTVQTSQDLTHWTNVGSGTSAGNGTFYYDITIDPNATAKFYRVQ